ncbi:BCHE [Cordylochernes scorpioides]|uniref:Carboxylic ester hydrolase n=1 Tax=Cordylochernes scorpioides TaxID=51811 RepID=A0ABY6LAZ9_9ARAC|nr:BCHE [Cordylochernes scorpioides]
MRQEFAAWVFRQIDIDENWLSNVLWTDKAHFSLNGDFNIQNSRIWATENPRIFTEMPLYQPRVTVLAKALSEITFMKDGGPPHISRAATSPTVNLPKKGTVITGTQKTVSGKLLDIYLSIPYAQPPTGERRFKDPEPITNLPPQIDATKFPLSCYQQDFRPNDHVNKIMSEDCLYLNIWTPSQKSNMSVLIFIHGGSFEFGSTDELMNNPQYLAARTDMVIVTMNYRLASFGFLDLNMEGIDGNFGLKDQILAFKWVKENIRAFGGNPDSVTIYGTSAGSMAVALHLSIKENRDLFHRAFLQSGTSNSGFFHYSKDMKKRELNVFMKTSNCNTNSSGVLKCLQSKTTEEIFNADKEVFIAYMSGLFIPTFNKKLFSLSSIEDLNKNDILLNKDILIGITKDEGSITFPLTDMELTKKNATKKYAKYYFKEGFGQPNSTEFTRVLKYYLRNVSDYDFVNYSRAFKELLEDYFFRCPTFYFSNIMASKNNNVFFYYFTYQSEHKANNESTRHYGATHNEDLPYTMGLPRRDSINYTPKEIEFSNTMMDYIGNFSKYGRPGPQWPEYIQESSVPHYNETPESIVPNLDILEDIHHGPTPETLALSLGLWASLILNSTHNRVVELNPNQYQVMHLPHVDRCTELWRPFFYPNSNQ